MASMANSGAALPSLRASFAETLRVFAHDLFDDYRPERHYMRGPGPKWREKHGLSGSATPANAAASPLYPDGVPA